MIPTPSGGPVPRQWKPVGNGAACAAALTVKKMTTWPYLLPGYQFGPYPYLGAYRAPPAGFEEQASSKR